MLLKNEITKLKEPTQSKIKNTEGKTDRLKQELLASQFKDKRLEKRFNLLCKQLWNGVGEPIPFACQDWANTKAAYRFFSNDNVDKEQILEGHFQSTKERFSRTDSFILVLQDTTEFSYKREHPELYATLYFKACIWRFAFV